MSPTTAPAPRRSERAPKPKQSALVDALRHQIALNEDESDDSDFCPGGQSDDGGVDKNCDDSEAELDADKKAKTKKTAKLSARRKAKTKETEIYGAAPASKRAKR